MSESDQFFDKMADVYLKLSQAYLGEKIKKLNILNQNGANLVYTHGRDIAHKLGFSEDELANITPFPAPTTVVINKGSEEKIQKESEEIQKESPEPKEEKPNESGGDTKKKTSLTHRILPWVISAASTLGALGIGVSSFWPETKQPEDPPPIVKPIDPSLGFKIEGFKIDE